MNKREMSLKEQNIVFIGFMGVGKTTIGKLVAKKLYRDFVDVDVVIEEEFGMSPTEIFKTYGEKAFRDKEKEIINDLCQKKLQILSLGGGAFLQEEIRKVCLANSIVIFLDLSWEQWKDRISLIIDSRPVLQGKTLEEVEQLFYERQEIYTLHNSKVQTDNQNEEEVANYIVDSLKLAWDLYA